MKYGMFPDFLPSARNLRAKGGKPRQAAERALSVKALTDSGDDPFTGLKRTKHGETRIKNCVKYDLPEFFRLITIQTKGICVFCFVGDHDDSEKWLNRNRGLSFTANKNTKKIEPVFASQAIKNRDSRIQGKLSLTEGKLFNKMSDRYLDRIADKVPRSLMRKFEDLESINTEEEIFDLSCQIKDEEVQNVIFDVFIHLKSDDVDKAKKRIDLYANKSFELDNIPPESLESYDAGEGLVDFEQFEPDFIEHMMKTTNYQQWMLFMHPEQIKIVERDFNGPAKLSGVSGSGKTCVIIKRAINLAKKYPNEKILVLTLNISLGRFINDLMNFACPENNRDQIIVTSFWEFCREELKKYEPENEIIYNDVNWKLNEHISDIWEEYYHCKVNNYDAEVLFPVHRSLLSRSIYPQEYLRQELDYIRSVFCSKRKNEYYEIEREGRAIPFDKQFREYILSGLDGWEDKMKNVGVVDYLGISSALYKHIDKLENQYRCILVDEVQDFGTLELEIIRKLVPENENDLFISGDTAQVVTTKHHKLKMAGINVIGRSFKIVKNYRNSREILEAAYKVLDLNLDIDKLKIEDFEILNPEYANFSTPKPLLFESYHFNEEFGYALNYLKKKYQQDNNSSKSCIAICGFKLNEIKKISDSLSLPILDGSADLAQYNIFISDLEQTKGFEFDTMCIINCSSGTVPDPFLPEEEWYREITKLYVAMTRAKQELILSYSGEMSIFLDKAKEYFICSHWKDHENSYEIDGFKLSLETEIDFNTNKILGMTGKEFLYTKEAIGLPLIVQDKMISLIKGKNVRDNKNKQVEWKNINEVISGINISSMKERFGPETYSKLRNYFRELGMSW